MLMIDDRHARSQISRAQLQKMCAVYEPDIGLEPENSQRINRIDREFRAAFKLLETMPKSVSVFGSNVVAEGNQYYGEARRLAARLVKELGYAVVTGGGPGIMEAANRGAAEAGGVSVGFTIDIAHAEPRNRYANQELPFHYFFTRKVALSFAASMYIFFPGGYGTLDEFFELITLVQTRKIQPIPIYCYGSRYWHPIQRQLDTYARKDGYISDVDFELFTVTDDLDLIIQAARHAPTRE